MTNNWLLAMPASLILVSVLMTCLCWRKKRQKNDWLGLDGMVTQKNPDENVNHLPSITIKCESDNLNVCGNNSDLLRSCAPNTTRRSLPDIPLEGLLRIDGSAVVYEVNGDNASELYATVEPPFNKRLVNGIERLNISQHSSTTQADDAFSPYARVNYDKLRTSEKMEHPYARVQSMNTKETEDENSSDETTPMPCLLHQERPTTSQNNEPIPPPRSRRSSDQSLGIDISAATAVAGAIPANQELPYMTPPIAQTNFSGDSQDSSKGYTSISVREPLANIRAQTNDIKKPLRDIDRHYSTVSDDSDEVYTTIHDPNNQVYTSGSETYAQIQSLTVAAEINTASHDVEKDDEEIESAPQPPSVDSLKNVAHSRQASSSSSVANVGSPKPEKRQANSPLPPPPPVSSSPDLHAGKNLDDMYAKVQKNRKKNEQDQISNGSPTKRKPTSSSLTVTENIVQNSNEIDLEDHNYETLKKSSFRKRNNVVDPGYEKLKSKDDEELNSEPGYASINGPDSLINSDPGYEVLKQRSNAPSEIDPNYEELHDRLDSSGYSKVQDSPNSSRESDGYSTINKQRKYEDKSRNTSSSFDSDPKDISLDEPNYESMPSESTTTTSDQNYSNLKSTTESESDPNYESVNQHQNVDDNYESVKNNEPPYERLNDDNDDSYKNPGYETIKRDEPPYQQIKSDNQETNSLVTNEKMIKKKVGSNNNNKEHDSDEDIVIQV